MVVDLRRILAIYERNLKRYEAEGLEEQAARQHWLMAMLKKRAMPAANGDDE